MRQKSNKNKPVTSKKGKSESRKKLRTAGVNSSKAQPSTQMANVCADVPLRRQQFLLVMLG